MGELTYTYRNFEQKLELLNDQSTILKYVVNFFSKINFV